MFENIINWIIDNKDSLISNVVVSSLVAGTPRLWSLKYKIPNGAKILMNIKIIKYLGFILRYALPLGTIVWMTVDTTNQTTFKNIALFILICVSLIFNILMEHIISIYKIISDILETNKKNFSDIDSYAGKINASINELKEK